MTTGIFFLYLIGERLNDFPEEFAGILERDDIRFYEAFYEIGPAPEQLLLAVHTPRMVEAVRRDRYYETALYSTGGTVLAAQKIAEGEIKNAFVFTGTGDHHAGRDYYGGGCHFNGAALAIEHLRRSNAGRRFAIVDTDCHHGDGTRDIFQDDRDVLHICLCHRDYDDGTNVDIAVPYRTTDDEYLRRLRDALVPRLIDFGPEMVFWEFGYDATSGDYGDKGLTPDCHPAIAGAIRDAADETCHGGLVAILCGGSSRAIARRCIPGVIRSLIDDGS